MRMKPSLILIGALVLGAAFTVPGAAQEIPAAGAPNMPEIGRAHV